MPLARQRHHQNIPPLSYNLPTLSLKISGVIVAPGDEKRCNDCISRVLSHEDTLGGVALSGLTDGNEDNKSVTVDSLKSIFRRVGVSIRLSHWVIE